MTVQRNNTDISRIGYGHNSRGRVGTPRRLRLGTIKATSKLQALRRHDYKGRVVMIRASAYL